VSCHYWTNDDSSRATSRSLVNETENGNLKELELLVPYPADEMRMWEISPRVNSPKNDDPSLWEPIHSEPTQTNDALELLPE
jgi:putative SOS response-associated peptidase YedK